MITFPDECVLAFHLICRGPLWVTRLDMHLSIKWSYGYLGSLPLQHRGICSTEWNVFHYWKTSWISLWLLVSSCQLSYLHLLMDLADGMCAILDQLLNNSWLLSYLIILSNSFHTLLCITLDFSWFHLFCETSLFFFLSRLFPIIVTFVTSGKISPSSVISFH